MLFNVINLGNQPYTCAEKPAQPLTFGICLASPEEGARVYGPIELLPFEHPVAAGQFKEYWSGTDRQLVRMGNLIYREPHRSRMFFVCLHAR